MSSVDRLVLGALPETVLDTLEHFEEAFGASLRLIVTADEPGAADEVLYQTDGAVRTDGSGFSTSAIVPHLGPELRLQVLSAKLAPVEAVSAALTPALAQGFEATREIQFFTYELSERFEEITALLIGLNVRYKVPEGLGWRLTGLPDRAGE